MHNNSSYFRPQNMILTMVSPRCDLSAQKIQKYHFDTLKDGQVKVVMEASSEKQRQEILQKLTNQIDFLGAKAVDLPHPKAEKFPVYKDYPILTIELAIPSDKVKALVGMVRELELPHCQLKEQQFEAVAYKYPGAAVSSLPSSGK